MLYAIVTLLCLSLARPGESTKFMKSLPTISNSLVNLGKVDISFYINSKNADLPGKALRSSQDFNQKLPLDTIVEMLPCPCSSLRNQKDNPTDMLSKILSGNDLFSSTKPPSSISCCDSHENQEETIFLDFGPKPQGAKPFIPFPQMLFDTLRQNKSFQPKTMEFLVFPPKKLVDLPKIPKDIQVVGAKKLENHFKSLGLPTTQSSVKKDLNFQTQDTTDSVIEDEKIAATMNTNVL